MLSVILWCADSLPYLNVLGSVIGDVLAVRISNKKFPGFSLRLLVLWVEWL